MRLNPAGDCVLIVDAPQQNVMEGIELPDNQRQQDILFGAVADIGPKVKDTVVGDVVCYGPYAGKLVLFGGTQFRMMKEGQIEGYVTDDEHQKTDAGTINGN